MHLNKQLYKQRRQCSQAHGLFLEEKKALIPTILFVNEIFTYLNGSIMMFSFCFQKIRTIELDGKTIKLQIVSKHFLSLLLIINFIITCNKFNLIRDIVCFSK